MKKRCKDCGKKISKGTKFRCMPCYINSLKIKENNPRWKGGPPKCIDCGKLLKNWNAKRCKPCNYKKPVFRKCKIKNGYRYIFLKEKKWIAEHRLIMQTYLKRALLSTELVHHRNRNRQDNRIRNLKILTNSQHFHLHSSKENNHNWKGGISANKKEYLKIYKRTWNKKKWKDPIYREKERQWAKISYEKHKEKRRENCKSYYQKNRKKILQKMRKTYHNDMP